MQFLNAWMRNLDRSGTRFNVNSVVGRFVMLYINRSLSPKWLVKSWGITAWIVQIACLRMHATSTNPCDDPTHNARHGTLCVPDATPNIDVSKCHCVITPDTAEIMRSFGTVMEMVVRGSYIYGKWAEHEWKMNGWRGERLRVLLA